MNEAMEETLEILNKAGLEVTAAPSKTMRGCYTLTSKKYGAEDNFLPPNITKRIFMRDRLAKTSIWKNCTTLTDILTMSMKLGDANWQTWEDCEKGGFAPPRHK